MKTAVIGSTGFVGGTVASQHLFDDFYHSQNIQKIRGKSYDLIVCAGAPGTKWIANKYPEQDRSSIKNLIEHLKQVKARTFLLISTIDIYKEPVNVDETSPAKKENLHPYGLHRLMLELFVSDAFKTISIVRLPALFGRGLKKNMMFDLIHENYSSPLNPESTLQLYNTNNLWHDLAVVIKNKIPIMNFATEPLKVHEIISAVSGNPKFLDLKKDIFQYDMHTLHARFFGKKGTYLYTKQVILNEVATFIKNERKQLPR